jgi:hypothetical protein
MTCKKWHILQKKHSLPRYISFVPYKKSKVIIHSLVKKFSVTIIKVCATHFYDGLGKIK